MHLYVYYTVGPDAARGLIERVRAMQASLAIGSQRFHLRHRVEAGRERVTWMEVYEDVPSDFEIRLADAVERHGIASSTGPRHVERFVDVD